ncbi:MAG: transcriptional regulator [Betaproteobacteria bacterium HGW-Betaproteobacteria-15]|nr:MAG: transcriptional regulator [Betaproteobacteria bacterium HGW-Betaproteobacteria-15]
MGRMPALPAAQLLSLYPAMGALTGLLPTLQLMRCPAGTELFRENNVCQGFPLVVEGEVRVSRSAANGRELELYRVQPGEMCLVSSAGLFAGQPLSARGVTTMETALALLPPDDFQTGMAQPAFRSYVLGLFAQRMTDLTALIEAVAFQRLDSRLAAALLGHGPQRHITHQALADELGTVREIVTRLLHRFEREGLVELSRECITVRDSAALRELAALQPR